MTAIEKGLDNNKTNMEDSSSITKSNAIGAGQRSIASRKNSKSSFSGMSPNMIAKPKRSLIPARRLTSRTMIEKVVEKTFGEENKEKIF